MQSQECNELLHIFFSSGSRKKEGHSTPSLTQGTDLHRFVETTHDTPPNSNCKARYHLQKSLHQSTDVYMQQCRIHRGLLFRDPHPSDVLPTNGENGVNRNCRSVHPGRMIELSKDGDIDQQPPQGLKWTPKQGFYTGLNSLTGLKQQRIWWFYSLAPIETSDSTSRRDCLRSSLRQVHPLFAFNHIEPIQKVLPRPVTFPCSCIVLSWCLLTSNTLLLQPFFRWGRRMSCQMADRSSLLLLVVTT